MSIVIDLSQTDTKAFSRDSLIQVDAKRSFENIINNFLIDIDKNKDKDKNRIDRVHNTILINGKRGMGKTSFILSVEEGKKTDSDEQILEKICSLGIIDPTLIETKEHVFLNIITLIKDKVEKAIQCNKCDHGDSKYKNWKNSLKMLAGGLSMLDGVGSDHLRDGMWDSPELIMEKGLSNAKQGYKLEENFHFFIKESLKILEREAFFLVLDDIDTSLKEGRNILETLRKYLTSRKLIIAMLGDIDLYSTLVRQLQWEKMDPNGTLKKYEGKNKYLTQIEHLEEQYLTKVLKPENRIDLKNLLNIKENLSINTKENKFSTFVHNMINEAFFTQNSGYTRYYENTLLTQSTRSVIQILLGWEKYLQENKKNIFPSNDNNNNFFITSIKHTFYTTLKKKLGQYNLLEIASKEQFLNLLSVYILKEKRGSNNHLNLIPEFSKEDENITMFYINAMANEILEPKNYLSYFIKVGYVFEVQANLIDEHDDMQKFIDEIVIDDAVSSSFIAEKLLATFTIAPNTIRDGYKSFGNIFVRSADLNKIEIEDPQILLCEIHYPQQGTVNFFSFFKYLGFAADTSSNISNIGDIDNELKEWLEKSAYIEKLPLFVLAKIWVRMAKTLNTIEERSENKNKNIKEIFELYIIGFLNAVYVETELYYNRKVDLKNVSTSTTIFYDKINKADKRTNFTFFDYLSQCPLLQLNSKYLNSLTEFVSHIEIEKIDQQKNSEITTDISKLKAKIQASMEKYQNLNTTNFNTLKLQSELHKMKNIKNENNTIKLNRDFSKIKSDEQKLIIKAIDRWQEKAIKTISNYLRYNLEIKYEKVSDSLIEQLLKEMKS